MAATRLKVTYLDGKTVEVLVSPRAQVDTERKFPGLEDAQEIEISYHLAWASLHRAGKEGADFESFLDQILEVEQLKSEVVDPTPPTPQPGTSSG